MMRIVVRTTAGPVPFGVGAAGSVTTPTLGSSGDKLSRFSRCHAITSGTA
jgi:hypothetical protein